VASPLLIEISTLDTTATAISAEQIGRMNPQSGDMRQLDRVIWHNETLTEIVGVKDVRPDEFWVTGHIPGRPLMPGVLMIEAAAQLCSILYRMRAGDNDAFLGFARCDQVAFRGQVVPGDVLYLLARQVNYRPRRVISDTQAVVNGELVYEGRITGILL
jgi:3-hydroxyacyl-[acyl-carrier-protein] dehydratase